MPRKARDQLDAVVDEVLVDELDDALAVRGARDVVGALLERGNGVADRHATLGHGQEHVIVLGVADADGVVR